MLTAGAAILLFAGAAMMLSSSNILSMSGGGAQRRLQGATVPLRRLATTDYGNVGPGFCAPYDDPSIIGSPTGVISPSAEDCSAKCDDEPTCVAFDYDEIFSDATTGGYYPCILYDDFDPAKIEDDTGTHQATCYVKISFLNSINESYISVLGDPLFTGFQGQVLKFEGRDSAWYANLASPSLQWNLNFHKVSLPQLLPLLLRLHASDTLMYFPR